MIAKLISHGATREEAAERLADACGSVEVWPVKTNAAFLAKCASHPDFVAGDVDTGFIERRLATLVAQQAPVAVVQAVLAIAASRDSDHSFATFQTAPLGPWAPNGEGLFGFRLNTAGRYARMASVNEQTVRGDARPGHGDFNPWQVEVDGEAALVDVRYDDVLVGDDAFTKVDLVDRTLLFAGGDVFETVIDGWRESAGAAEEGGDGAVISPMPGKIVSVSVKAGDTVTKGQTLLVLEAMKMEHALAAPFDGVVAELSAEAGGQVSEGVVLVKLEAA
jgi:propionyl-CoA carboxylase alpha chain/3-methylcrotonyl-CoA carboxylase alpha subunit